MNCTCATDGNARRCSFHTQTDYENAANSSRLVRVGWGRLRTHFPERGPIGTARIDPAEVVAVRATRSDAFYREQAKVYLRSGDSLVVFGTVEEVLRCLGMQP